MVLVLQHDKTHLELDQMGMILLNGY